MAQTDIIGTLLETRKALQKALADIDAEFEKMGGESPLWEGPEWGSDAWIDRVSRLVKIDTENTGGGIRCIIIGEEGGNEYTIWIGWAGDKACIQVYGDGMDTTDFTIHAPRKFVKPEEEAEWILQMLRIFTITFKLQRDTLDRQLERLHRSTQ